MDFPAKHIDDRPPQLNIATGVIGCARCGEDHPDHDPITFRPFYRPVVDEDGTIWGYWGTCPTTGDPILLRQPTLVMELGGQDGGAN